MKFQLCKYCNNIIILLLNYYWIVILFTNTEISNPPTELNITQIGCSHQKGTILLIQNGNHLFFCKILPSYFCLIFDNNNYKLFLFSADKVLKVVIFFFDNCSKLLICKILKKFSLFFQINLVRLNRISWNFSNMQNYLFLNTLLPHYQLQLDFALLKIDLITSWLKIE